jgi:hypothetical protein
MIPDLSEHSTYGPPLIIPHCLSLPFAIVTVFEILLHFLNGNDWSAAIRSVIPERKGLKELHGEEGGAAQEERGAGSERAVADDKGATVQDAPS